MCVCVCAKTTFPPEAPNAKTGAASVRFVLVGEAP